MNMPRRICLCALLLACTATVVAAADSPAPSADAEFLAGTDRQAVPGDDFYAFANGEWLRTHEIPPDRSNYSNFAVLDDQNQQRIADLIRDIGQSKGSADTEKRKIADYYDSFMDESRVESQGLTGLRPTLDRITGIRDRTALASFLGGTLRADVDVLNSTNLVTTRLFGLWIAQDLDDPSRYVPFILQGGLGMPDRDYYQKDSPEMVKDRASYQSYIATILKLAGESDADASANAERVMKLEQRIAQVHTSREASEDVKLGDNHWTRDQFDERAPGIDWNTYFAAAGLERQRSFVVWQPRSFAGIAALVGSEPIDTWKSWLTFHTLSDYAPYLPKAFVDAHFAFYGTTLTGTPVNRERWKRAISSTNVALGDAVGKLYVQRYFPPEAKARIEDLVHHLIEAFAARIDQLQWMAPQTRQKARAKLATLKISVGYPEHWRDYSTLEIRAGDLLGNVQRAELFDYRRNLAKLTAPVDRTEWVLLPQEINAVNLPAMNALNFPAAILQPPYFDPKRPASLNYGEIGAIIGHEISHSFDDQGALFDSTGRLQNWWTDADYAHFRASAKQLVAQYSAYRPFDDLSVNGQQTLSENIADLAGLACAYSAYHLMLDGHPAADVDGLSGDQQFFVGFEQAWRGKVRDAALRRQIITDGHAPSQYRGLTVRNLDAWYAAFDVKPGQKLYLAPDQRVRMW
ncbi:MAG TPA: M13 family metallopeptidase [Steroidobacteraceae bacterium]|nr:M13 family metallopeptidase [Steroidobacteraceae bacterium]